MRLIPLQSTNLVGIAYAPGADVFYACFNGGSVYSYTSSNGAESVADSICAIIFDKDSIGGAFNRLVKGSMVYTYHKLTVEEIEALELDV